MLDHGAPTSPILAYASDHPVATAPISGFSNVRTSAPIRPLPSAALLVIAKFLLFCRCCWASRGVRRCVTSARAC
eukprot:366540-Chlamydomonas_euryale.AAC.10